MLMKKILFVFTILLIIITLSGCGSKKVELTQKEKNVVNALIEYKDTLKNPDSLKIYHIYYEEKVGSTDKKYANLYVDCSGENSFGGPKRNIIFYMVTNEEELNYLGNNDNTYMKTIIKDGYEEASVKENEIDVEKIINELNN